MAQCQVEAGRLRGKYAVIMRKLGIVRVTKQLSHLWLAQAIIPIYTRKETSSAANFLSQSLGFGKLSFLYLVHCVE